MTIEELKVKCHGILLQNQEEAEKTISEILEDFLRNFHIEIDGHVIIPTEVEAYCHCASHPDMFVHRNDLQKKRFGFLYVHRHPDNPHNDKGKNTPKGWAGIDVCLSDDSALYFGMLIRAAIIDGHNEITCGPYKIYRTLKYNHADYYLTLEESPALVQNFDRIEEDNMIFYSERIGLTIKEDDKQGFLTKPYRAVIAKSLIGTPYRDKEKLFNGMARKIELSPKRIREILGYVPANLNTK